MVVVQRRERNVQKKRDAHAKLLSLLIEPFDFFYVFVAVGVVGSVDANQSMCCRCQRNAYF